MKMIRFALLSTLVVVLLGCVPSLNPVYTAEDLIFDESLVGTWTDARGQQRWRFEPGAEKSYRLTYTDQQGRTGRFVAHLAKVRGVQFLDLFPMAMEDGTASFYKFHLVPIHTVYVVNYTDTGIEVAGIDYQWLDKQLAETPSEISQLTFGDRRLIAASTKELQDFLIKHKAKFSAAFQLKKADST